jgi:hypothetical protein
MRHPIDTKTYEDYLELVNRYRGMGLTEMEAWARKQAQKAFKDGRRRK